MTKKLLLGIAAAGSIALLAVVSNASFEALVRTSAAPDRNAAAVAQQRGYASPVTADALPERSVKNSKDPSGAVCADSDGGISYSNQGVLSYGGDFRQDQDRCIDKFTVREYFCKGDNIPRFDWNKSCVGPTCATEATCVGGCYNGACVPATYELTIRPVNSVTGELISIDPIDIFLTWKDPKNGSEGKLRSDKGLVRKFVDEHDPRPFVFKVVDPDSRNILESMGRSSVTVTVEYPTWDYEFDRAAQKRIYYTSVTKQTINIDASKPRQDFKVPIIPVETAQVRVRTVDDSGARLSKVPFAIVDGGQVIATGKTDAKGESVVQLARTQTSLKAETRLVGSGRYAQAKPVQFNAGRGVTDVTLVLERYVSASLNVTVVDTTTAAVDGATVALKPRGSTNRLVGTTAKGFVRFDGVTPGAYTLTARKGNDTASLPITLKLGPNDATLMIASLAPSETPLPPPSYTTSPSQTPTGWQ